MSYWHTAARLLRQAKRDLEETESGLSEEVLTAGAAHRHWRVVAEDTRDALREAQMYIEALERDREIDRVAAYKRGLSHAGRSAQEPADDAALPRIDPASPDLRTRWFRTRSDALAYAANNGFRQQPEKRRVWVDLAWRDEWSLRAPMEDPCSTI